MWLGVSESGQFKRTALFMAALAYKQKQWIVALEISKNLTGNPIIEHIKLLTLIEIQCYDEMIVCLSSWSTDEKLLKVKLWKDAVYIQCLKLFAEIILIIINLFVYCSLLQFDKINQMLNDIPSESSRDQVRSMLSNLENDGRVAVEVIEILQSESNLYLNRIVHYFSQSMITSIET